MKESTGFVALCLSAAVGFAVFSVRAQAPTRVALQVFGEKVTDEQVRVLDIEELPPGQGTDAYTFGRCIVTRTWRQISIASDVKSVETECNPDYVIWHLAAAHSVDTMAKTPLHAILVELNGTAHKK